MKFAMSNPTYSVIGSCDDKDPATGPGQSYNSANKAVDSCTDGNSFADSRCLAVDRLRVTANAQTAHSTGKAVANAKAVVKSTLTVTYSWWEALLAFFGLYQPELTPQVAVALSLSVKDGTCGAGFTVFISNGPNKSQPIPSWQGLFSIAQKVGDPTKLEVTRPNTLVETIANPGNLNDWPDGPTFVALEGTYDLTFEANAIAAADGIVSVREDCVLGFYEP